jgi:hypothetical protein
LVSKNIDFDHKYTIIAGATPKLTKSANESNSTPKFELVLRNLANLPSRLSKNEEKTTRATAICHLFSKANLIADKPRVKEINVIKFGTKLLRDNFFMIIK